MGTTAHFTALASDHHPVTGTWCCRLAVRPAPDDDPDALARTPETPSTPSHV
ncbi:hypothetical protein ACFQH2_05205 [Natronoarchaeum sp. GCM10025703]|uniref:hypothetical protein n=1 Tax=unclassified Natronoarchaeum TaxID=2620183 RepID=UPI00360DE02E